MHSPSPPSLPYRPGLCTIWGKGLRLAQMLQGHDLQLDAPASAGRPGRLGCALQKAAGSDSCSLMWQPHADWLLQKGGEGQKNREQTAGRGRQLTSVQGGSSGPVILRGSQDDQVQQGEAGEGTAFSSSSTLDPCRKARKTGSVRARQGWPVAQNPDGQKTSTEALLRRLGKNKPHSKAQCH